MFTREFDTPSSPDQLLGELGLDQSAVRELLDRPAAFDIRDDQWRGGEEV